MPSSTGFFKKLKKASIVFLLTLLSACNSSPKPAIKPTRAFYINDRAEALLTSTQYFIYNYSSALYEDSGESDYVASHIDGAQVVVATYVGNAGDINSTDLFNAWKIGKNNMGVLIILFFDQNGDEFTYKEMIIEIADNMSGYMSATHAEQIAEDTFDDLAFIENTLAGEITDEVYVVSSDYDLRLMAFYYGIMEFIYLNVYEYGSYNYPSFLAEYYINQYESFYSQIPHDSWIYDIPVWGWILIIVGLIILGSSRWVWVLLFSVFSGGNKGGGGKSGGYWFRR